MFSKLQYDPFNQNSTSAFARHYFERLRKTVDRSDITLMTPNELEHGLKLEGLDCKIILDHYCQLTRRQFQEYQRMKVRYDRQP